MIDSRTACHQPQGWHELYRAALFELNPNKLPRRIADAERAIVARTKELSAASADTIEEDQALADAHYGLQALQNSVGLGEPQLDN